MELPAGLTTTQTKIQKLLEDYFAAQCDKAQAHDAAYGRLWNIMRDVTLAGGKRLRPFLLELAYRGTGGVPNEDVWQVAAAWELLHTCLLIHDDIIDRDNTRHGQLNVAGRLIEAYHADSPDQPDTEHYALGGALLAGDLLLSASYDLINTTNLSAEQKQAANGQLHRAVFAVAGGELLDTEAVMLPLGHAKPTTIIELKTAYYSVITPLCAGALLAGADAETIKKLETFGMNVGIGYQLMDDLLGVFGDTTKTGKPVGSDLIEGKRTVLLEHTRALASPEETEKIDRLLSQPPLDQPAADHLQELIIKTGAKEKIESLITDYKTKALEILETLDFEPQAKIELAQFVEFALKRNY